MDSLQLNYIDCIPFAQEETKVYSSPDFSYYNNFNTWIPYCNSEPLKNPPITTIELTFHVFLDDNGGNSKYLDNTQGRLDLIGVLNNVNRWYRGSEGPSDPVAGVQELPNYDSRVRFSLGESGSERIYFYRNSYLNKHWNVNEYNNFIESNYPERDNYLNVYWSAGHYGGYIDEQVIEFTNHGSGYTSPPTVTFSGGHTVYSNASGTAVVQYGQVAKIEITNRGFYNGFDPPVITFTGGGGTGAAAIVTEILPNSFYSTYPLRDITTRNFVMLLSIASNYTTSWGYQDGLTHELGHCLNLHHTYCSMSGSSSPPYCCSGSCYPGCTQNCTQSEYLPDIFGTCPGTCPHLSLWKDPYDETLPDEEKITNNILGGTGHSWYISPGQAGKMHRSLAILSVRKYVDESTYIDIPYSLSNNQNWDFDIRFYRDLIIPAGKTLTCSGNIEIPENAEIKVTGTNSRLIIEGNFEIKGNRTVFSDAGGIIDIKSGANVIIHNLGCLNSYTNGSVIIRSGANVKLEDFSRILNSSLGHLCIESGANIILQDSESHIILNNGSYMGNEEIWDNYLYIKGSSVIPFTGSGYIIDNNQDIIISNINYTYPPSEFELIKKNVTINYPQGGGPVVIYSGTTLDIESTGEVTINKDFEVKLGGGLEIK